MSKVFLASAAAAVVASGALYTVDEREQAVITRFGEPIGTAIVEPGLHVKVPFADRVNRFEKRWLEWNGDPNQIPTRDKKYIWVSTFARWRISDPLLFYQRMTDERNAVSRIDDIIDGETRNTVATYDLIEAVRASNREFEDEEYLEGERRETFAAVAHGRNELTRRILERAQPPLRELGVELVDVQFKRINYVEEVQLKVFDRMISERKRIAERFRSEGLGESAKIRGEKERELAEIRSEAFKKTEEIRGKADAEASRIYAGAYGKDPEFYEFVRSLESYRQTVSSQTSVLIGTDSDFYKYLTNQSGKR
ncbi:protease modulator HflC [Myxococcota bacterium]|nr:protease modulator HflC [Myxococcota bacterium]